MRYLVTDVCNMKQGTLDAMLCGPDSGLNSAMMIAEASGRGRFDPHIMRRSWRRPQVQVALAFGPGVLGWKSIQVFCQVKGSRMQGLGGRGECNDDEKLTWIA